MLWIGNFSMGNWIDGSHASCQFTASAADKPLIRVLVQIQKLFGRKHGEVRCGCIIDAMRGDPIDAAVAAIPFCIRVRMSSSGIVPVGDIDSTIRAGGNVGGSEPWIFGEQQFASVSGGDR